MKQSFLKKNWMIIVGAVQLILGCHYFFSGRYDKKQTVFIVFAIGQILCGLGFMIYGF